MKPLEQEFVQFIDSLGFKNFSGREMLPYFSRSRKGVKNSLPPKELWPNIVPTLVIAQELRTIHGPVIITSSYRSPDYNRAVGGERQSYHIIFNALDLIPKSVNVDSLHQTAMNLRGKRFRNPLTKKFFVFKGGIGHYPGFIHVDTRGVDANW